MDIACASICYRGYADDEVAATLELAPAAGYRLMEIHGPMTWSVEAVGAFDLPAIRTALARSGMECIGVYSPGWGGANPDQVREHTRAIARCAAIVEDLGGDHVTSTGAVQRGTPGGLESVIECALLVLDQLPSSSPVRLCLEPHFGNVLQDREDFEAVLAAIPDPRLGLCVDTGHFHSAGVDTVAFIHDLAPRIYNVHVKDHLGTVSVGIGRGEIDLAAIVAALREIDYTGALTVELEVEDPENLPRYAHEAYVYVSGLLGQKL